MSESPQPESVKIGQMEKDAWDKYAIKRMTGNDTLFMREHLEFDRSMMISDKLYGFISQHGIYGHGPEAAGGS